MDATAAAAGIAGPSYPVNRVMDTLLMNHIHVHVCRVSEHVAHC